MTENVDLPRLKALTENWIETPPLHVMFYAANFEKKQSRASQSTASQEENASELLMQFPQDPMTLPKGDMTIGCSHIRAKNE